VTRNRCSAWRRDAADVPNVGGTDLALPAFMKTGMNKSFFKALLGIAASAAFLAACETTNTSEDLVGTWQRQREDATLRDQFAFKPDGAFTFDEFKPDDSASEDHITGTYTATDTTVTATGTDAQDGVRVRLTFTYYANDTAFACQALRPTGAHTGVVGEWTATVKAEFPDDPARSAEGATATYQFRADGTFSATLVDAEGTTEAVAQGTYQEEAAGIVHVIPTGQTTGSSLQMIDDAALAFPTWIFHRAD
jgi:hypothetical protein